MRARDRGRAFGQIVALGAMLAVIFTAAPGTAMAQPAVQRQQQEQPREPVQQRVLKIYVVFVSAISLIGDNRTGSGRWPGPVFCAATLRC